MNPSEFVDSTEKPVEMWRGELFAEITPAARPAASRLATWIVDATGAGGADADADPAANTAATDPPENTTPRRVSRSNRLVG